MLERSALGRGAQAEKESLVLGALGVPWRGYRGRSVEMWVD